MLVDNIARKNKYTNQIHDLENRLESNLYKDDELGWMVNGMLSLVKFMYDNKQYQDVDSEEIVTVPRVIRLGNYIDLYNFKYEYVTFVGVYVVADVTYIPIKLFKKNIRGHKGNWYLSPDSYGLPSYDEVGYNSFKESVDGKYMVALTKSERNMPIIDRVSVSYDIVY